MIYISKIEPLLLIVIKYFMRTSNLKPGLQAQPRATGPVRLVAVAPASTRPFLRPLDVVHW